MMTKKKLQWAIKNSKALSIGDPEAIKDYLLYILDMTPGKKAQILKRLGDLEMAIAFLSGELQGTDWRLRDQIQTLLKGCRPRKQWEPKIREIFYFIDWDLKVVAERYCASPQQRKCVEIGNCFSQAQIKKIIEL